MSCMSLSGLHVHRQAVVRLHEEQPGMAGTLPSCPQNLPLMSSSSRSSAESRVRKVSL